MRRVLGPLVPVCRPAPMPPLGAGPVVSRARRQCPHFAHYPPIRDGRERGAASACCRSRLCGDSEERLGPAGCKDAANVCDNRLNACGLDDREEHVGREHEHH
eukprot:5664765-Prymnesium_polylepis.1